MTTLTKDDFRFLDAVAHYGGKDVTTTQIRRETGFGDEKTRYRHTKLEQAGFIIGGRAGPRQNDPRTATLSDRGRRVLDSTDWDAERDPPETLDEIHQRLSEIETRLELASSSTASAGDHCDCRPRLVRAEKRLDNLSSSVEWHERVVEAIWMSELEDVPLSETLDEL